MRRSKMKWKLDIDLSVCQQITDYARDNTFEEEVCGALLCFHNKHKETADCQELLDTNEHDFG